MNEDIEVFLDGNNSPCYIESLIRCRHLLKESPLLTRLDEAIALELDLAVLGAEKAKSEIIKSDTKENKIRPIK